MPADDSESDSAKGRRIDSKRPTLRLRRIFVQGQSLCGRQTLGIQAAENFGSRRPTADRRFHPSRCCESRFPEFQFPRSLVPTIKFWRLSISLFPSDSNLTLTLEKGGRYAFYLLSDSMGQPIGCQDERGIASHTPG
jgi:hypothetical protein